MPPLYQRVLRTVILAILITPSAAIATEAPPAAGENVANKGYVGNEACARCHSSIYLSYMRTPMARASGPANKNIIPADFVHANSGVHYRIYSEDNRLWLSFERPGDPAVKGKRELLYYIGSGRRGLTYLFAVDGFIFESPVNWYAKAQTWDMTPAYQNAREAPLNLPTLTSCLRCHVSGMQPPLSGTENRYPTPLFAFSGINCERCHGPGAAHVGGGAIINPAKLRPERRDAICMQCHLEGKAGIERKGRHAYDFQPGDALTDYIRHYVLASNSTEGLGAVSEVEALAQSACKKKTGDAMSCTTCHDPHYSPDAKERVSYYRGKCLACHGASFGSKHHAQQADCTACHMPSTLSTDVAHTQVTDHRIPRRPPSPRESGGLPTVPPRLVPFPHSDQAEVDVRDLALAWESFAEAGMDAADEEARHLLRSATADSRDDPVILSAFGYLEQRRGAVDHARELYQKALALDPTLIDAATNLGVIEAKSGHWASAVRLWQDAFQRAPGRSGIGMNIARAFCGARKFDEARSYLLRILEFNPDMGDARELLRYLNHTPPSCGP
jgi:hypothetical protein